MSGDFLDALKMKMKSLRVKHLVQTRLHGVENSLNVKWLFIGFFSAERLGIDRNEWWKVITDRKVLSEILS